MREKENLAQAINLENVFGAVGRVKWTRPARRTLIIFQTLSLHVMVETV